MAEKEEMDQQQQQPVEDPNTDNLSSQETENVAENDIPANENEENAAESEEKGGFFNRKGKKEAQLKKQIEEMDLKNKELTDRFARLYSEFDNYKKRTNKEKLEIMGTASERVIVELLPVIDDFERAIAANEKVEDIQVVKDGFNLIYNKLQHLLNHFDVTEIKAKGEVFNTDFHEAVTHFPAPTEEEKGKVIDVTQKGYKIKEKVIRFSKVVVGQ